jgi:hypothetical protein
MQVSPTAARAFFHRLPATRQAPSLHPAYVQADATRDNEFSPVFFVYQNGGDFLYHAFHLAAIPGGAYHDIQSPYGYGGPVGSTDDPIFLAEAWQAYSNWCSEQQVLAEFVRFHPLLDNGRFFSGTLIEDRATVWVDLKLPDLLASYQVRARTAIRKAIKQDLRVEWWPAERFYPTFKPLYYAAMKSLSASSFYFFPPEYFSQFAQWECTQHAVCLHEGEVIAAAIFLQGTNILEYHLSATNEMGKKLGATNLLLHKASLYGQQAGCCQFHLGGGSNAEAHNSLLFFKSGFSDQRASFNIGKKIHDPTAYLEMKSQWQAKTGRNSSRVLFYREN